MGELYRIELMDFRETQISKFYFINKSNNYLTSIFKI